MSGFFWSGKFRFQAYGSDEVLDLSEPLEDDAFDLRLSQAGGVPDLHGAPIASWLLARLARLMEDGIYSTGTEWTDGGGYMIEFVVSVELYRPVAVFQFLADMAGAAVLGDRAADCDVEEVLQALAAALLDAPNDLRECRLAVIDPEWKEDLECYYPRSIKGSRNWYGWDGSRYFGADNIRDAD